MRQAESERSEARSVSRIIPEAQRSGIMKSETKCTEACWTNYPLRGANGDLRLAEQRLSPKRTG